MRHVQFARRRRHQQLPAVRRKPFGGHRLWPVFRRDDVELDSLKGQFPGDIRKGKHVHRARARLHRRRLPGQA